MQLLETELIKHVRGINLHYCQIKWETRELLWKESLQTVFYIKIIKKRQTAHCTIL